MKFKVEKSLFKYCLIEYVMIAVMEFLYYSTGCQMRGIIICLCILELFYILYLAKRKLLFSPIILSPLLVIFLLMYQLKLVNTYEDLAPICVVTIYFCSFVWKIINSYDVETIASLKNKSKYDLNINISKFKMCIYIIFPIAVGAMLLEWYAAGGIPFFRVDGETFRFTVSINGITHILAIMNKIVAIMILAYWISAGRIRVRKDFSLIIMFIVSTTLILFTSMRGELIVILAVGLALFYIKYNPSLLKVSAMLIPVILLIGAYPIYRQYNLSGQQYINDQMAISAYPNLWFITPLYQTISYNTKVLDIVIQMFPGFRSFGLGSYAILSQIPFVDLGLKLNTDISAYTNHSFYSGLTSTYLGPNYADWGIAGCIVITIALALWARWLYKQFIVKRNLLYSILYAFMFYNIIMMTYANTIIELSFVCYYALIYLICKVCTVHNETE